MNPGISLLFGGFQLHLSNCLVGGEGLGNVEISFVHMICNVLSASLSEKMWYTFVLKPDKVFSFEEVLF